MLSTPTISATMNARPGRRGAGSKPARERTTEEFSAAFKQASSDSGYARAARRTRAAERKLEREADGTAQAERDALEAAKQAWEDKVATHEQKQLVRRHEKALDFVKRRLSLQPAHERIHQGFEWPGGWVIEGEIWRDPFVETGLRTWRHPFYQRVLASMGKASTTLCTGDTKDGAVRQFSKLHGSDKLYGFFAVKCRDMWRLDCDRTFANEAEMLSWLAFRVMESGALCMPHLAVWIPDDRYPGVIRKPHFYFLLPEGRAVWPTAPDSHHRLHSMPGSRTQKQASSHPSRPESSRTSPPCALRSRSLGQTAKSKRRLRNSNSSNDKCMGVQNLTFSKHDCSARRDPRCVIKYASDPKLGAD